MYKKLIFSLGVILCTLQAAHAAVRKFELVISPGLINPDCNTHRSALLVNGEFPAPPIRVKKGDQVHVTVRNGFNSTTPITIHFHGILQIGTPQSDGVPMVTQEPILPGEEYQQVFNIINQTGTYFYHAHVGLLDETIFGPFIVYENDDSWPENRTSSLTEGPYQYDDERTVQLSEYWHQSEEMRYNYTMGPSFGTMSSPNSYLINGRTIYDSENRGDYCEGYSVIDVQPQKTYRLRVIGAHTIATLGFAIAKHSLTVIEVDGTLVEPYQTDYLEVAPGQRFSVLLHSDQTPGEYHINTTPYYILVKENNGAAVLRYSMEAPPSIAVSPRTNQNYVKLTESGDFEFPSTPKAEWIFPSLKPINDDLSDEIKFYDSPARTIVLMTTETKQKDNTTRWTLNGRYAPEWGIPIAKQSEISRKVNQTVIMHNILGKGDGYDQNLQTYPIKYGEIVDFVIHATTLPNGVCVGHPWHTHGMVHYALAYGPGEYNHQTDSQLRTFKGPLARDTTFVYPIQPGPPPKTPGGKSCGWTKIRIHATNPGPWAFHCHVTSHMLQGMMTVLEVAPEVSTNVLK